MVMDLRTGQLKSEEPDQHALQASIERCQPAFYRKTGQSTLLRQSNFFVMYERPC